MKRKTILAAMAAAAMAVSAQATAAATREEPFHWQGKVSAGDAVEIKGVNGGIVATRSCRQRGRGHGDQEGPQERPAEVKVEVVEHDGGVTICAVYPSSGAPNECKPGQGGRMNVRDNDVNVEFKVTVPAGVRFVGRTVNGGIEASGITADAEAHTVNGGVELEATGTAHAETVNGGINARLGRTDWTGALNLKTVNGGIEMTMPDGLSADLKASTVNGEIQTDFPLTVTGRISRRKLEGTIGSGGRLLELLHGERRHRAAQEPVGPDVASRGVNEVLHDVHPIEWGRGTARRPRRTRHARLRRRADPAAPLSRHPRRPVVFSYGGDLWTVRPRAASARRLTAHPASRSSRSSRPTASGSPSPASTTVTSRSTSSRPRAASPAS